MLLKLRLEKLTRKLKTGIADRSAYQTQHMDRMGGRVGAVVAPCKPEAQTSAPGKWD